MTSSSSKTVSTVSDDVLAEAIVCCDSWEPDARLIGNVRAVDLGDLLRELRGRRRESLAESAARGLGLTRDEFNSLMSRLAHETFAPLWIALTERQPPEDCPRLLVTNNVTARDACGDHSHIWLTSMVHKQSDGSYCAFDEHDMRLRGITHWRYAVPEDAARLALKTEGKL